MKLLPFSVPFILLALSVLPSFPSPAAGGGLVWFVCLAGMIRTNKVENSTPLSTHHHQRHNQPRTCTVAACHSSFLLFLLPSPQSKTFTLGTNQAAQTNVHYAALLLPTTHPQTIPALPFSIRAPPRASYTVSVCAVLLCTRGSMCQNRTNKHPQKTVCK